MANEKVRVALVGAGHVAQIAHIPAYQQNPSVELVAVVDEDPVKAKRAKAQYGFAEWYEDFTEMLDGSQVDAVDICTPNYLHAPMAIAALRSGKDVLCEKPLARNAAEAGKMIETAKEHDRTLMAAMNNRFRRDVRVLHEFIGGKELGDVHFVKAGWLRRAAEWEDRTWFTKKVESGGGALLDLGVPLMDLAMWVAGFKKPTRASCSVFGKKGRGSVEDSACAMVRFAGGGCLMLEVNWNLREPRDRSYLQVYGSKGAALLHPLEIHKSIQGILVNVTPKLESTSHYYKESYRLEIDHFIECVQKKKSPLTRGIDALPVIQLLDAMYESAYQGREVEFNP